jgi:phospholipid transport system substrate-binding protein
MKILLGLLLTCVLLPVWGEGNPDDAHALVGERIQALMARIEALKNSATVDEKARILAVEDVIGEAVDFKRMTRRVMAKYYKKSSKQQKIAFYTVFKATLLNTYAQGLWEFEDYKINLKPLKNSNQSQRNTQVELDVVTASGHVYSVVQSLFFHKKYQRWMIQNVIISGVNIGQLFRDQFSRLVVDNQGDLDLAIKAWRLELKAPSVIKIKGDEGA